MMRKDDYMKLSKARLAELLAERDARDALMRGISQPIQIPPYEPSCFHGGPCTNPQMDCINCPRRGYNGGINVTTSTKGKE
jgi:hypothetical protein